MKTNTQIKGDLAVCCDTTLAGRCTALGNATVKGSLKVEGWLEANNLKQPCKGLYPSEEALIKAYPRPLPGWWALVGDSLPAEIFVAIDREWLDSGNTGGSASVALTVYDEAIERANSRINDLSTQIGDVVHPVSVADTSAADLIIADEALKPIATFRDGHIITANFNSAVQPLEIRDTTAADLILADASGNAIATFKNGHIITANFNSASVTASSSSSVEQGPTVSTSSTVTLSGKWCALGDSITYQDEARANNLKGYQYWVKKQIYFAGGYVNKGQNGAKIADHADNTDYVVEADYYTIAYGTNEYLGNYPLGDFTDYTGATGKATFYGAARTLIDTIRSVNPSAAIIICTPRKCYVPQFVGPSWQSLNSQGLSLLDYVEALREIAQYESLPVADFFAESMTNMANLASLSIETDDSALHPSQQGHKLLASVLIPKLLPLQYI